MATVPLNIYMTVHGVERVIAGFRGLSEEARRYALELMKAGYSAREAVRMARHPEWRRMAEGLGVLREETTRTTLESRRLTFQWRALAGQ